MAKKPQPRSLRDDKVLTYEQMVGGSIGKLRASRGLSQEALRAALRPYDIRWTHIKMSNVENGKSPVSIKELLIIANYFNVSPLRLLFPAAEDVAAKVEWFDGRTIPAYETTDWMLHPDNNADWFPMAMAVQTVWEVLKDDRRPKEERIALAERMQAFVGASTDQLQEAAYKEAVS